MFTIPHKNSLLIVFLSMVFSTIAWILVLMRADPFSSTAWPTSTIIPWQSSTITFKVMTQHFLS